MPDRSLLARLQGALSELAADEAPADDLLARLAAEVDQAGAPGRGEAAPEDAAARASQRMAFILAYLKDPGARPIFAEKAAVYEVVADERAYQQGLVAAAQARLAALPPDGAAMGLSAAEVAADPRFEALDAERAALGRAAAKAEAVQAQLFTMLKELTGRASRKTGGTAILAAPAGEEASLDALLAQAARKIPPRPRP